jgi:SPP1 gp7 family putative phage head morphogenesis protein
MSIPKKLFNEAIRNSVNIDRYGHEINRRVQALLRNAENEIVGRIAANDPTRPTMAKWKMARMADLQKQIRELLDQTYKNIDEHVDRGLLSTAENQTEQVVKSFNRALGVEIFRVTLAPEYLKSIVENTMVQGHVIGEWWAKQSDSVKNKIGTTLQRAMKEIQAGLVQGEAIGELISRVRGTATRPGIILTTRREATTLVRTSVMQIANATRMETYKKNADVLDGYEWCSTLDSRTTILCAALSGKRFDMDLKPIDHDMEFPGGPPCHFNCRSVLVPYLKSWAELLGPKSKLNKKQIRILDNIPEGMRETINGPVPMNMNYNQQKSRKTFSVRVGLPFGRKKCCRCQIYWTTRGFRSDWMN